MNFSLGRFAACLPLLHCFFAGLVRPILTN